MSGEPQGSTDGSSLLAGFSAGSRIAGYRLEELIGAGGMAVVFRAIDERLGRQVALKRHVSGITTVESASGECLSPDGQCFGCSRGL